MDRVVQVARPASKLGKLLKNNMTTIGSRNISVLSTSPSSLYTNILNNKLSLSINAKRNMGKSARIDTADAFTVQRTTNENVLALNNAAYEGKLSTVIELIESKKVNPALGDYDGRSALHIASIEGHKDIVTYLVEKAKVNINAEDRNGMTALQFALESKNTDLIKYLKSKGAVIGRNQAENIAEMFCSAAVKGDIDTMQLLLDCDVNINITNIDKRTPLHIACAEGNIASVEFLIKNGAQVNVVDRANQTPLMDAERGRGRNFKLIVKVLLENGASQASEQLLWSPANVKASIQGSLNIIAMRYPRFTYIESWLPTFDGSEYIGSNFYLHPDLMDSYGLIARENIGRIEHKIEKSEITKAFETRKPVILQQIGQHQIYHKFSENDLQLYHNGVTVPVVHGEEVVAILRLYSSDIDTAPITAADAEILQFFISGVVASGIYGATPGDAHIPFNHYNKEISPNLQREVYALIAANGVFSPQRSYAEVDWFFKMGLATVYFNRFGSKIISNHVQAYIASKQFSQAAGAPNDLWLAIENNIKFMGGLPPEQSLHMIPDDPRKIVAVERNIIRRIKKIPNDKAFSLEMCMSAEPFTAESNNKMALYVLQTHDYANPAKIGDINETNIWDISSDFFLKEKTKLVRERYQELISEAANTLSPVAKIYPTYRDGTIPLMFAFRFRDHAGPTTDYMLSLTQLLVRHNLQPVRKFIETFANQQIVFSLYLHPNSNMSNVHKLMQQFSMLHLVPQNNVLTPKFLDGTLNAPEYTYLSAAARILYYIISQRSDDYTALSKHFKNDMLNLGRLRSLYTNLRREGVSHSRIMRIMLAHPKLISKIYQDFEYRTTTKLTEEERMIRNVELESEISRSAKSNMEAQVLQALLLVNRNILKTNFFKSDKASISFRLDPRVLGDMDLPSLPYGIFFVMGADFQGFHVRFSDVSRGGIRLIRSRDELAYNKNLATQFQESFNLAFTQNLKNKDIPEFGSKGTILLNMESQAQTFSSFQKFVSGLLDILVINVDKNNNPLPESDPNYIVDNYGREELLFLGPDEGTAGYMEWAALYARERGYRYWRAFTTGKPSSLGGIPHDTYGMTTTSVHRYVVGCIEKLGLKEEECTKIQTGGPDGDLGSNEILMSKDKTIGVIDGMGVAYDPAGLNRDELVRLAKLRITIDNFDRKLLSKDGFIVTVNDTNVTLPNGEVVENGVSFRNDFHLHPLATADLFVPCGGRPESINMSNVHNLFDAKTNKPKFKILVEGANLFVTQDARMVLEEGGIVLYKDASSNKGGVTSSSLEVLGSLSLPDDIFAKHMAVVKGEIPPFYLEYVNEIRERITTHAALEFECIWREHERTGIPRFLLTDRVSNKINELNKFVHDAPIWDNVTLRKIVLSEAIPSKLQELVGLDGVIANAPESYLRAIFSAYLASRYVYKYGIEANEFSFFDFMQPFVKKAIEIDYNTKK